MDGPVTVKKLNGDERWLSQHITYVWEENGKYLVRCSDNTEGEVNEQDYRNLLEEKPLLEYLANQDNN
jgi:hypothetical protein